MRWSVWHTVVMSRTSEKLPPLDVFLDGVAKPAQRQTSEQIEATFHAMFGAPPEDS